MTQVIDSQIGDRVHHEMWRLRITQKQVSDALGVDQAAVSRRLRGRTAWKVSEVFQVARLLGISPTDLLPAELAAPAPRQPVTRQDVLEELSWTTRRYPIPWRPKVTDRKATRHAV